jgi:ribonuclease-3
MSIQDKFQELAKKIGVEFKDIDLFKKALTHRSYLNEHKNEQIEHNERLEFLGDAVLELIVTEYLFEHFQNKPEGDLTNLRAALVKGENLTKVGRKIGIGEFLLLSKGEAKTQGKSKSYIIANAIEAIIGAIYLDQGYQTAEKFIIKYVIKELPQIIQEQLYKDSKSLFQEKAQEIEGITPIYKLLAQSGPDHDKFFEVGVYLDEDLVAKGQGRSKQEAQQKAAQKALDEKNWN